MTVYSLDTDTITKLLKKHPGNRRVLDRFRMELQRNSLFIMCPVVFYEIRRELVIKNAGAQLTLLPRWRPYNSRPFENIWTEAGKIDLDSRRCANRYP